MADRPRARRTGSRPVRPLGQQGFDDLGTPLRDVTFCVIDLETTGASPASCEITEVGAVKLRGGECLGTLQTLVNPGSPIPPSITVLTGITQAMVIPAPTIDEVLPSLLEFLGDAVIVGHNVRFDISFLDAALERRQRPRLANARIDTLALARRLVRDEVPNCKLGTLAERLRLDHRPNHRALDDALATGDLLHLLLERAGGLGVTGLDDLLSLPTMSGHAQAMKLRMTDALPRSPGVYLFTDRRGHVLYVGKATNLRARVRSYFSSDDRRKIGQLLRETEGVQHIVTSNTLEAAVREVRLIHALQPRFNRQAKDWTKYRFVRLTLHEPFPRLSVVKDPKDDGDLYLGPLSSTAAAKRVIEAVETALPLRRCSARPGRGARSGACTAAQLGVATCPCAGDADPARYQAIVATALRGLGAAPDLLLTPLTARLRALAEEQRFEEAADTRARAEALTAALSRQRRLDAIRAAGHLVIDAGPAGCVEIHHGIFIRSWSANEQDRPHLPGLEADALLGVAAGAVERAADLARPLATDLVDELLVTTRWLEQHAHACRIVSCGGGWDSALPKLPSFQPRPAATDRRAAA